MLPSPLIACSLIPFSSNSATLARLPEIVHVSTSGVEGAALLRATRSSRFHCPVVKGRPVSTFHTEGGAPGGPKFRVLAKSTGNTATILSSGLNTAVPLARAEAISVLPVFICLISGLRYDFIVLSSLPVLISQRRTSSLLSVARSCPSWLKAACTHGPESARCITSSGAADCATSNPDDTIRQKNNPLMISFGSLRIFEQYPPPPPDQQVAPDQCSILRTH